jgi:hypothetical protein
MVYLAGSCFPLFSCCSNSLHADDGLEMKHEFPHFDQDEVALLVSAVQKALERLKNANEARGGNDPEFLECGRRYSVILRKLNSVLDYQP